MRRVRVGVAAVIDERQRGDRVGVAEHGEAQVGVFVGEAIVLVERAEDVDGVVRGAAGGRAGGRVRDVRL